MFVIAAEGLAKLVKRALEVREFEGFKVNDEMEYQFLQFEDDTILVGESTWQNLWSLKVLRGFELVFGLRIKIRKSKLYGLNTKVHLMEVAS